MKDVEKELGEKFKWRTPKYMAFIIAMAIPTVTIGWIDFLDSDDRWYFGAWVVFGLLWLFGMSILFELGKDYQEALLEKYVDTAETIEDLIYYGRNVELSDNLRELVESHYIENVRGRYDLVHFLEKAHLAGLNLQGMLDAAIKNAADDSAHEYPESFET